MPRIGVTGHVMLAPGTAELVYHSLLERLEPHAGPTLHGVTCLADGVDQLFARAVLALDGSFEVIVPAADYRSASVDPGNLAAFDELLGRARSVHRMGYPRSGREAYMAASLELLDRSELLLAVWDGTPSAVLGDTADVVRAARSRGLPVTVLWPTGAARGRPAGRAL